MKAPYIRLLATQIGGTDFNDYGFKCHYFFDNGTRTDDVPGAARAIGRKGLFIFCPAAELVRAEKVVSEGPEGTAVVSYAVDAPASVSIGCREEQACQGHWTFSVS